MSAETGLGPQSGVSRRSSVGLVVAICVWSLSPLLIYESRGLADPPILALYAVGIGSLLAFVVVWGLRSSNPLTLIRTAKRSGWLPEAALVGLGAFVVYPLLYFSAIQNGPPVAVNLVNYLWPVVAVVVVAIWRSGSRSLETALAASFGFAGAGLAITADTGVGVLPSGSELTPFALAALAALAYGGTSGAISLRHPTDRSDSFAVFTVALFLGGFVAWLVIGAFSVVQPDLLVLDVASKSPWALLAYSALLPVAHLSWMTAVRDPRVPAFPSAFLVPVLSTGILALVVSGVAKPEVLSALVLVLCGITFSSVREKGVPVGYAVSLAFLSSIQVSQILASKVTAEITTEVGTLSELIAATSAIFAGFILSNAIQRNGALHAACSRFYARAATAVEDDSGARVTEELDALDGTVILGMGASRPGGHRHSPVRDRRFAREWADVEVAVSNSVSDYEWLVLLVGGGSLILALHAYAVESTSEVTVLLRALAVSLVVGILFAVRDYDRRRPELLCRLLSSLRSCYDLPVAPDSPLGRGVEYWSADIPMSIRVGLAALVVIAVLAIVLNA